MARDTPRAGERRTYRVYGRVGGGPTRLSLVDRDTGDPLWVTDRTDGIDPWPGMLLTGTVSDGVGGTIPELSSASVCQRATLAVTEASGCVPEPVWDAWTERDAHTRRVVTVLGDGEPTCECHVRAPEGDPEAVWRRMLTGRYRFEPWFDTLVALDSPARHVTVVSPTDRPVFVVFATPASAPERTVTERRERLGIQPFPRTE